ncbi:ABC transporter substrate-binding protein [Microvirga aerophila]|uniref:ABC transporter substrate-binding protein n=2 Tax=Microvirga aerophila TaxID=670291 RepID=A0A512BMS3_9HYPH|nr:ABC transporter substrate-binding protein [Microvirga aerophila]GEO13254.1 ABC transporter substrate-binding protein [Microvirga aerophila]
MTGLLASALAIGLVSAATAAELPDRIKKAGKIVVATMPNYAPITFKDPATNKLTGFDIDLGEALAKELGVAIEWQEIAFAQMIPSLQTGRVDLALAGMSDLPGRREIVDFVDYMKSGAQFYTSPAMAATIKTPEDLCGKKVGASRSTNWPRQITEWSQANCVAKGKPAIESIGTEGSADARTQLKTQRIDAAVQGNETLPYFQSQEPNTYVLIGEAFTTSLSGVPVLKTETQLRDAVKEGFERLQQKGVYDEILKKYGLQANKLSPIGINQGTD